MSINSPDCEPTTNRAIGFLGADVCSIEHCFGTAIFGVNRDISRQFGDSNDGAIVGIRSLGTRLRAWTKHACRQNNRQLWDVGIVQQSGIEAIETVLGLSREMVERDVVPLAIGCDHTISFAQAIAISSIKPFVYLYFDAHLDLGWHWGATASSLTNGSFVSRLLNRNAITQVINIGARASSRYEPQYHSLRSPRIVPFNSAVSVIKSIEGIRGNNVYVSIDPDVLDPAYIRNVSTPEPFGVHPSALLTVLRWVRQHCSVVGADLSELRPDDPLGVELAMRLLGETTIGSADSILECDNAELY